MPNNYFEFKQFKITHQHSAMKVGTDGVLIGAWADVKKAKNILDIGTGTGLIAIMLAQRSNAKITAIEIEQNAYNEAVMNVGKCKWSNHITTQHISLQSFAKEYDKKFDLIICNPPFFNNSLKSKIDKRTIARHTAELNCSELMYYSSKLLSERAKLALIIPFEQLYQYQQQGEENGLFINRQTDVKPTPTKNVKRVMLEFSKNEKSIKKDDLLIEEFGRHQYSEKYKKLTADFYKFMV